MKQIGYLITALLLSLFFDLFTPIHLYASGNEWVDAELRVDLSSVYNAQDYTLYVKAGQLPPSGTQADSATSTWLAVNIRSDWAQSGFFQVGLLAQVDGLHWFVEMFDVSNSGVTCLRGQVYWRINNIPAGCRGAVGDLVGLNQWHKVELVKYTQNNYWIARVYDSSGGATDVAKIFISNNRIYRAMADFEQAYSEASNPHIPGQSWLKDPQYYQSGWKSWPFSAVSSSEHSHIDTLSYGICPTYYGTTPFYDLSNPWQWFAGSGGTQCAHLFQPAIYDNNNSAISYTGSWSTCSAGTCPRAWKTTLHSSNVLNSKATLMTLSGYHPNNSLSRVYSMGPDRGNGILKINGSQQWSGSDYSAVKRWQVTRSWAVSGATNMEVLNNTCGGCNTYTDVDSFIVDIPRAPAPADNNTAPGYDNYHYLPRFVGSWTHNSTSVPSAGNGTLSWTNTPEDSVSFTFEGTSVKYYYTRHWNRGIALVTIDGVDYGEVNACGSPTQWHVNDKFPRNGQPALSSGIHTVTITAKGTSTCGSGSSYNYIDLDEFRPLQ